MVKEFGLHELLIACVADSRGEDVWSVREQFEARPKKGDAKLLAACRDDVPDMPDSLILAIFDGDKLHRLLAMPGRPTKEELQAELRSRCPDSRLHMFLLVDNTETVVEAAADCQNEPPPKKDKLLRDRLLTRAARIAGTEVRDCVRQRVPSFDRCVQTIAQLTAPSK